ncbi:MAG: DMT family transporter [Oligoflexia bacterium]|nr:DMT family transporter [Oligoflexia bacterium]
MSQRLTDKPALALIWMAASALGFSCMAIFVKRLALTHANFELVFYRSIINFLLVLLVMMIGKEPFFPPEARKSWRVLLIRGVAGFSGASCLFYSIGQLPLPIAMMLSWSSPIFVILFSRLFLSERLTGGQVGGIAIAFLGLLLLVRPEGASAHGAWIGSVGIAIFGAACAGGAYVAVRAATARVGVNLIVLCFVGISALLSFPLAAPTLAWPSLRDAIELLLLGAFATFGQIAMTQGYRFAPAGVVSTMSLLTAAFSAFFGWALFDEWLTALQWLGMVVLAVGIIAITLRGTPSEPRASGRKLSRPRFARQRV